MNVHIVFAHPNIDSFNGRLRSAAINLFKEKKIEVTTCDLYQIGFKAAADQADFTQLNNPDFFDLQAEQSYAAKNGTFANDIQREQKLLLNADLIIFQFPLWWYSMPALLKGYIDRIFSMGWAYGGNQALAGKKILVSMTTGAPGITWTDENRGTIKDIFKHLFVGTFGLCGISLLGPFIVYGAKRLNEVEKNEVINNYVKFLNELL